MHWHWRSRLSLAAWTGNLPLPFAKFPIAASFVLLQHSIRAALSTCLKLSRTALIVQNSVSVENIASRRQHD